MTPHRRDGRDLVVFHGGTWDGLTSYLVPRKGPLSAERLEGDGSIGTYRGAGDQIEDVILIERSRGHEDGRAILRHARVLSLTGHRHVPPPGGIKG